jgi:hypothetical protein
MPFDFPIAKPAPGRLRTDALLSRIIVQLHAESRPDYAEIVEDLLEILITFSILSR